MNNVCDGSLPSATTSFVGRRQALADIRRILPAARLLTLTGAGGIGKTRLALAAAANHREHVPDGVWLVDLTPLRAGTEVAASTATALGLPDLGIRPVMDQLTDHLARRRALRDRATALRPDFRLTASGRAEAVRLCSVLDGLPLAIELAASRLRTLSVKQLAHRPAFTRGRRYDSPARAIGFALDTADGGTDDGGTVGPAPRPAVPDPLSRREREVAALVAKGMTNRQAVGALGLSPRTAETRVASILSKLGFSCRAQIAA